MSIPGLVIASVLFLLGLIGAVLPVLPGVIMVFAGTLVYGIMVDFQGGLNLMFYLGQGVAVLLVFLVDYLAGIVGAKKFGGSRSAVVGSILGLLLGVLTLGPFGLIIGPFAGAVAGEYYSCKDTANAFKVGIGTLIGFLGGTFIKLAVEIVMIIWFFLVVL